MKKINDFTRGWLVGKFSPSLFESDVEIGIHFHPKGTESDLHFHRLSSEYNVVLSGQAKVNGKTYVKGDIFTIKPYTVNEVEYVTDCEFLVIRDQSNPSDKVRVHK